ncbi:MAG: acyltransferase [Devosiaceae bacterium]|nr:acyltransferase [Devosiaceae bacterium MH13]
MAIFQRVPSSIDALDGLRTLAIALVIGRHVVRPFADGAEGPLMPVFGIDLANVLVNGWVGVDLFFVLSGFLVAHHLLKRDGDRLSPSRYGHYVGRRALRILPAYYAVLALLLIGAFPFFTIAMDDLGWRIGYHLLLLQDVLPSDINVVFWSLGVEWKFYLLLPFALAIRPERVRLAILLGLACAPFAARAWLAADLPDTITYQTFFETLRSPFYACFEGLVLGVLCALIYRRREAWIARVPRPALSGAFWLAATGLILLLIGQGPLLDDGVDRFGQVALQSVIAILFATMMLAVLLGGGPVRALSHPSFLAPARLSYAAYLVHLPLMPLAMLLTAALMGGLEINAVSLAVCLAITVSLTVMVSLVLHILVEKPFMALGRRGNKSPQPVSQTAG